MRYLSFILLIFLLMCIQSGNIIKQLQGSKKRSPLQTYDKLPLTFIKNEGQLDRSVPYYIKQQAQTIHIENDCIVFNLFKKTEGVSNNNPPVKVSSGSNIARNLSFCYKPLGINKNAQAQGFEEQLCKVNYFIGNNPSMWKTNICTYKGVVYKNIYDGISLKVYGNGKDLETEYLVQPEADPSKIVIKYEGVNGLKVDEKGDLIIETAFGDLRESKPYAYQQKNDRKVNVNASYMLISDNTYTFALASYDKKLPLVIDPALSYSTYLGGSGDDIGLSITTDSTGATYVTGYTASSDFPTRDGSYDTTFGGAFDAFVTKIDAAGSSLIYSTYLGGSSLDYGYGITVDSTGACYITGNTTSSDFPTTAGAYDTTFALVDAFVTKIDATGSALVYSTYLGGSGNDYGWAITIDSAGAAYVAGETLSTDFPTTAGAYDTTHSGNRDAFVTKINATGSDLVYSTYIGGSDNDYCYAIRVDSTGAAYVAGTTLSDDFPTTIGAYDTTFNLGEAFVTKIDATGSSLSYSTFLGGSAAEYCVAMVIDSAGAAYVTGYTNSTDFPTTAGAYDTTLNNFSLDAFVTKIDATGSALIYSTYLGGSGVDNGWAITIDSTGDVYVTGYTNSSDFPTTTGAYDTVYGGGSQDAFVSKISPSAGSGAGGGSRGSSGSNGGTRGSGIGQSDSGPLLCFVATATYESQRAPQVIILTRFRDHYLLTNPVGCAFLQLYHRTGPMLADFVKQDKLSRSISKTMLLPVVCISHAFLNLRYILLIVVLLILLARVIYCLRNFKKFETFSKFST